MDIVITGFNYYGNYWNNPSGEVARTLDGIVINGYRVKGFTLPVSLSTVKSQLPQILSTIKPRLVLGLGLNPSTKSIDIELVAVNRVNFTTPDIDGYIARYEAIINNGPFMVYTTLPVEAILRECSEKKLYPIRPSLSTGLYLCNTVAYLIMKYGVDMGVPAGFLHIPPSTINKLRGETQHGIPLSEIINAVKCIIEVSTSGLK